MKIDVVDNGGQWTQREWKSLKELDVDSEIVSNDTPFEELNVDGLVLSGGSPRISDTDMELGKTSDYLDKADFPILGICVGAQFMARHFGGKTGSADSPEYGKAELEVLEEDDLFEEVPKKFTVWESHNDEIKELGEELILLASSENCPIQAFKHREKRFYGLQFHPEVDHTEHGYKIFENFIEVCQI